MTKEEKKALVDKKIEGWFRASGDCICTVCGKTYSHYSHKIDKEVLEHYPSFHLNLLCNGDYVKL